MSKNKSAATRELAKLVEAFEDKIKQRAIVKDPTTLFGPGDCYRDGVRDTLKVFRPILEAVLKMEDHRLIGHSEPDDYTKLGCLTNVAVEALNEARARLQEQYARDLKPFRSEAFARAKKEKMKEPHGPWNPAHTAGEAKRRLQTWADSGWRDMDAHEPLGWTKAELERFHETLEVPKGYEP